MRTSPKKILFVGEAVCLAHIGRPLVLSQWAEEAGYDTFFACGDAYSFLPLEADARWFELPIVPIGTIHERIGSGRFFYTVEELNGFVQAEIQLIRQLKPDLVVGDFRLSLSISTSVVGVPYLSLANAQWSPNSTLALPPPNGGIWRHLSPALRERCFAPLRPIALRVFGSPILNRVRTRYRLTKLPTLRHHVTAGEWCGYLDNQEMFPVKGLMRNHFYLGPVTWAPERDPIDLSTCGFSKRPLVYVTLGGSGENVPLARVVKTLVDMNCDVFISGATQETLNTLKRQMTTGQHQIHGARLVNPENVLKAASFTVCHGGSGTVYQSLAAGLPVLGLPGNPDQGFVCQALVKSGAGLAVPVESATGSRLKQNMETLLKNSAYRSAAVTMGKKIISGNTQHNWLSFLSTNLPIAEGRSPQLASREKVAFI